MLQELLLGLSGHSTPLFDPTIADELPLVTPAESTLLKTASRLSNLHSALKTHLASIVAHHPSLICRAVATSARSIHLARFQKTIVNIERDILLKDPSTVSAYDIVPLATVVSRFEPWKRRLEWYWDIACFIYPASADPLSLADHDGVPQACSGVDLINKLRSESKTGFQDIETVALELIAIAERVWVRQLSQWIISGVIPRAESLDFLIYLEDEDGRIDYAITDALLPAFVTPETANSILFLGKTMQLLKSLPQRPDTEKEFQSPTITDDETLKRASIVHLQSLANLPSPFSPASVSSIISQIRSSIANEIVDKMLPVHTFVSVLGLIRQFFLAGRGDFVDGLISEADELIASRHRQMHSAKAGMDLAGAMIKEGEVRAVLSRTWTALAPFIGKNILTDDSLDWARQHVFLTLHKSRPRKTVRGRSRIPQVSDRFSEFLLLTPVNLTVKLDSTFEIFLSDEHTEAYSSVASYLLAIRRGHNHLSDMWRNTPLRKDHPAPARPRRSTTTAAFNQIKTTREKLVRRMTAMRRCWTSTSTAICLLAELGSFLTGESIERSWNAFKTWATQTIDSSHGSIPGIEKMLPHDPEVLAAAHRQYLAALLEMLLLTDSNYTKALRIALATIEQLIASVKTLQSVQRSMDLQEEGVFDGPGKDYVEEERAAVKELNQATEALTNSIHRIMESLRTCSGNLRSRPRMLDSMTAFQPYQDVSAIDRLLMRLDASTFSTTGD